MLFVEGIVTRFYTSVEERSEIVVFKRLRGQDRIVLEVPGDVVEGILEGWPVHRAVVLVQPEQLPGSLKQ